VPQVEGAMNRFDSLDKANDERIIDIIDVIRKFDTQGKAVKRIVEDKIMPLYESYLRKVDLDEFEGEKAKVLPHLVIIPWLHLLRTNPKFSFLNFYKVLARKLWNLENSALYNIVSPLLKFSAPKDTSFFTNLCLGPRLLYLLESFSISNPNPALLNGFTKYSELLPQQIKDEILETTLFIEVEHVYRRYVKEKEAQDVQKWLKGWKKFSDKISPRKFDLFFQEILGV
jgi:hypothetical protein